MTRREQLIINDYCEREAAWVDYELQHTHSVNRLRLSNAWIYETDRYYVLKSFRTMVAFIRKNDRECFDILRMIYGYTATSAQHIAKFRHDYNATDVQTWREV